MRPGRATATVVVDASLVAMWVLEEQFSEPATDRSEQWRRDGVRMVAPCFMLAEVTNAIHQRVRRRELTTNDAAVALERVLGAGVELEEDELLHLAAARLAVQLGRGSTYDAHYLALAERHGCEVWTGDRRLYNGVRDRFPLVRWIGQGDAG